MITNQLEENIIQGWLLCVIRSFLWVGFRFQYQVINLAWFYFLFSMEQQPRAPKQKQSQNQVTSHSNWPLVILLDSNHRQCNGIIKECLHSPTSESKGRFIVNNLLMFGSPSCLVMAQIQFSLMKKIKIGRPEYLLTPHPPTSDNISFLPFPFPPNVDVVCVSSLLKHKHLFYLTWINFLCNFKLKMTSLFITC